MGKKIVSNEIGGPKFPPTCGECHQCLPRANTVAIAYDRCPAHPYARTRYHSQVDGRPIWSFAHDQPCPWQEWINEGD